MATGDVIVGRMDWSSILCQSLSDMRDTQSLCDVVLVSKDGKQFHAHSAVLAAASSYLGGLLSGAKTKIVMKTEIENVILDVVLRFIYQGHSQLSSEALADLEDVGKVLQLNHLVEACQQTSGEEQQEETLTGAPVQDYAVDVDAPSYDYAVEVKEEFAERTTDGEVYSLGTAEETKPKAATRAISVKKEQKPVKCQKCGTTYASSNSLSKHSPYCGGVDAQGNRIVHRRFECQICKKSFSTRSSLRSHNYIHTGEKPFQCSMCPRSFRHTSDLRVHERVHKGERPYGCTICNKTFSNSSGLTRHTRTHTGEKPYRCSVCGKAFTEKITLRGHVAGHTGEKPFTCKPCGTHFVSWSHLRNHRRTCDKVDNKPRCPIKRTYLCQTCGVSFTTQRSLRSHNYTHTGEKPFMCRFCPKKFRTRGDVMLHHRVHSGDRPYKCSYCEKTFYDNSGLRRHVRIHTGEKPYVCGLCSSSFTQITSVKTHIRKHHPQVFDTKQGRIIDNDTVISLLRNNSKK